MALNSKAIKNRIKSVKNTKKITKAMQMVSAAKMRKAVEAALNTREYAKHMDEMMNYLVKSESMKHPLFKERKTKNILLIVVSSNRGLCGSFNTSVLSKIEWFIKNKAEFVTLNTENQDENIYMEDSHMEENVDEEVNIDVIGLGKKGAEFAKKKGLKIVSIYEKMNEKPKYEDVLPITDSLVTDFKSGKYDKVFVIYTNYISALSQKVEMKQVLPISKEAFKQSILEAGGDSQEENSDTEVTNKVIEEYAFEPGKKAVFNYVIPRVVEMNVYQAILESAASEHSSRMIAMKNATESAGDLIYSLTLEFNKARQAAITQEISEIVSGSEVNL